ncbi:MAG: site-specific integrase [Nitrospinales bacterium]
MAGLKKGAKVKVEPVRKLKDIKAISKLLQGKPRDLLLWTMGINNGLRASDLVGIKVVQVQDLTPGDVLNIIEKKTGKDNVLVINKSVFKALTIYLESVHPDPAEYLFKSRKGGHISSQSVGRLVKTWCKDINLVGNYGAHTLRKTWGYHQRVNHGVGFEILCKRYNHSSPSITMGYLGIESKEIHDVLMNEIG